MSSQGNFEPPQNLKRKSTDKPENSNILPQQELSTPNDPPSSTPLIKKKKTKLGIKKEEELSPAYICKANEVTFFKIVNSKEEFENFHNLSNLEHSFNPLFTNQIFNDEEIIIGYKNLKIIISLTPRMLYPHIKIKFDSQLRIRDDLELLLRKHFEHMYETSDEKFLEKLNKEIGGEEIDEKPPKGEKIFSINSCEKNLEVKFFVYFINLNTFLDFLFRYIERERN